jgi:hypothetical protein
MRSGNRGSAAARGLLTWLGQWPSMLPGHDPVARARPKAPRSFPPARSRHLRARGTLRGDAFPRRSRRSKASCGSWADLADALGEDGRPHFADPVLRTQTLINGMTSCTDDKSSARRRNEGDKSPALTPRCSAGSSRSPLAVWRRCRRRDKNSARPREGPSICRTCRARPGSGALGSGLGCSARIGPAAGRPSRRFSLLSPGTAASRGLVGRSLTARRACAYRVLVRLPRSSLSTA